MSRIALFAAFNESVDVYAELSKIRTILRGTIGTSSSRRVASAVAVIATHIIFSSPISRCATSACVDKRTLRIEEGG